MRKNITLICVSLAVAIAAQGCIDTKLDMTGRSFKELCEISGGEVDQDYPMQCRCGSEDKKLPCVAGVVCMTDPKDDRKKICANDKIEGTLCDLDDMENTKKCESGKIFECQQDADLSYRWLESKSNKCPLDYLDYCMNSSTCAECENNTLQCNGKDDSRIDICVNGKWEFSSYCETGLCISDGDGNAKCAECIDAEHSSNGKDDTKCENDTLYTCQEGNWKIDKGCVYEKSDNINGVQYGDPVSCNLTNNAGCGVCKIGTVYCDDESGIGQKSICSQGIWEAPITCEDEYGKSKNCANSTSCGECKNDDTKCKENMYFVCNNGNWIPQESCGEFECSSNDKVCAECRSGDIKCENDETGKGSYRICNEYGLWEEEPIPCGEDVSCVKDLCSSASGECHAETVCGECLNNTQYCQAEMENDEEIAKQYNCVNGNLQILTCEAGICNSDNTACAECKPDSTKCENDAKSVCNSDGTWGEARSCIYEDDTAFNGVSKGDAVSCNGDTCGVCKNNESSYCKNDEQSGYGMRTMCEGGTWSVPVQCGTPEFPKKCLSLTSCGECQDGEEKCDNGVYKICENGNWRVEHVCALSCNENKKENGNIIIECYDCKPDDVKCENKVINGILVGEYRVCSSEGKWQTAIDCDFTCYTEYCSGCSEIENLKDFMCNECNAGEVQCIEDTDGAKIEACKNGKWEFSSYCNSDKCSINKTTCGECLTGDSRCKDGNIQQCENGSWSEPKSCGENVVCKTDKTCGACPTGKVQCTSDETGAKLEVCRNGQWEFSSYCESGKCKVGEENPITCEPVAQVLCFDGMTKCEDNKIYRCENYEWIKTENECDETKACVDGEVLSCTNSYDGYGNLIVCRDGVYKEEPCYIDDDPTKSKSSCLSKNSCGKCLNGSYKPSHENDVPNQSSCVMVHPKNVCVNGNWSSSIVEKITCSQCLTPNLDILKKTDLAKFSQYDYIICK